MDEEMKPTLPRKPRGFAGKSKEYVREIASRGGIAAHVQGTGHEFTSEEAREAGRKGGLANAARKRAERDARVRGLGG